MRRLSRTVTGLVGAGVLTAASLAPRPAGAAVTGIDMAGHSYRFDHSFADSAGGPDAVVHGSVPFAPGRQDPPDTADGAARFDGRPADFLTIEAPVLSYATADFTLDVWVSTTAEEPETVLDTAGCDSGAGIVLTLTAAGSVDLATAHQPGETPDDGNGGSGPGQGAAGEAGTAPRAGATDPTAPTVAAFLHAMQQKVAEDRGGDGAPGRVNDGRWHDITITRTGTTMVLAVDGRAIRTRTGSHVDDLRDGAGVRIGRSWCGSGHPFEGELDDLTSTPTPPAALPEVPLVALLPVSAAMIGGVVTVARRRRRATPAHRITPR